MKVETTVTLYEDIFSGSVEESRNMKVATFEAVVENGQIRLPGSVHLPEKAKVYVVIPGVPSAAYIGSPRLAHPAQASDFEKEVIEGDLDAGV